MNYESISDSNELKNKVSMHKPGTVITFTIIRNNSKDSKVGIVLNLTPGTRISTSWPKFFLIKSISSPEQTKPSTPDFIDFSARLKPLSDISP